MTAPAPADAHSILPLSVLEAMRNLDSPSDEEVAEYVDELLKKRLGLSSTVAAQIARYETAVRQGAFVRVGELEQILRLAGRRTDAALVFADGGRRAARRGLAGVSALARWSARSLPRPIRRAVGFRAARITADEILGVSLARDGGDAVASLPLDVAVRATPDGTACGFYASALAELLRQLLDFEGGLNHPKCRARGDQRCEWRTSQTLEAKR